MTDFEFKVVVSTDTNDHAFEVMRERLDCDENYGFDYQVDFESLTERESVFLVWDNSRVEHGENVTLTCVYGNRESAERHCDRENENFEEDSGEYFGALPFSIEERSVIG